MGDHKCRDYLCWYKAGKGGWAEVAVGHLNLEEALEGDKYFAHK